jgi:hypothetical protein
MKNGLSDSENELLALLSEECGEVVAIIGKIQRHGFDSRNPDEPDSLTNRLLLEKEIGHVRAAVHLLNEGQHVSEYRIKTAIRSKLEALMLRWLHSHDNIRLAKKVLDTESFS